MAVDNRTENRNYPLPDKDNKLNEDVLRLIAALQAIDVDIADIIAALATKAAVSHPHVISDITGLQDALNGKAASTHQHALNDLTDVDVSSAANNQVLKRVGSLWVPATLQIGDVNGLQAILDEFGAIGAVVVLKGTWDASTGVFPGGGQAKAGWSFIVSNSGVVDGVDFEAGDRIIAITDSASQTTYAGNWHKADYTDQVRSVAGKTGDVLLDIGDIQGLTTLLSNYAPRRLGEFFWYFGEDPPPYALVCDGSTISRTTYADLWAFAQTSGNLAASEASKQAGQFGPGNGSSTFTLPDLRREFIRGVYSGRVFGSWQADEIRSHSHHIPGRILSGNGWGVAGPDGERGDWFKENSYTSPYGGDETRPRNVALLPCIVF